MSGSKVNSGNSARQKGERRKRRRRRELRRKATEVNRKRTNDAMRAIGHPGWVNSDRGQFLPQSTHWPDFAW